MPVVSRLCEPISGVDDRSLAECLGLDGNKYKQKRPVHENVVQNVSQSQPRHQQCFRNCEPLVLSHEGQSFPFCGVDAIVNGSVHAEKALLPPEISFASQRLSAGQIANQATVQARRHIAEYFDTQFRLNDDEETTTRVPHFADKNGGGKWKPIITERQDRKSVV